MSAVELFTYTDRDIRVVGAVMSIPVKLIE